MYLKMNIASVFSRNEVGGYLEYRVKWLNYPDSWVPDTYATTISYGDTHVCNTGASNVYSISCLCRNHLAQRF